jgi:hypothetical protein
MKWNWGQIAVSYGIVKLLHLASIKKTWSAVARQPRVSGLRRRSSCADLTQIEKTSEPMPIHTQRHRNSVKWVGYRHVL